MPAERTCSQCGAPLPENAPGGRCPRCLVQLALEESEGGQDSIPAEAAHQPGVYLPKETVLLHSSHNFSEQAGVMIDRYKLLQQIGEGGFGTVFMAEQLEPVQRKVALKIIKAGMDTREIIARFEAERQALALMDHPNIAQVLDGGATASGRPYFVMELVRGLPITSYCDQASLTTRERLELFIKVCRAVQHAHQKGVIHRDLKPSNILITLHDGEPVPKVIDFGVAKALGQKLTDKTLFTRFEQMIGTPAYMSPEQAALSGLDVDTRSDIYSLGVLLYELLTGVTPLDAETLRQRALDEIRRMIRETDPPKPSTRLLTLGERLAEVAKHRHAEPATLTRLLRGDLDWITMKALEKDRRRRYETSNGLAADVERHLNYEPVAARPPSTLYRFEKAVRRHRGAFAAGTLVAATLVLGAVISIWQAARATGAEREQSRLRQTAQADQAKAINEAAKSRQVAQFLKDMLQSVGPSVALGRDTALLREILDKTAARLGRELTNQAEVEVELLSTLGAVYNELGRHEKAEAAYREALRLQTGLFGNEHPEVAKTLVGLGRALQGLGKSGEAETTYRQALAMQRKLLGSDHADVAISLGFLSNLLMWGGKHAEAEDLAREALALNRKLFGEGSLEEAKILAHLAVPLSFQGKLEEAEAAARQALAIERKVLGNEHPDVPWCFFTLGAVLGNTPNKLGEAEENIREALELWRKLLGNDHRKVAASLEGVAEVLYSEGKLAEAESTYREALALHRKGDRQLDVSDCLLRLGYVLWSERQLAPAEAAFREAVEIGRGYYPAAMLSWKVECFTGLLLSQNRFAEAEQLLKELPTPAANQPDGPKLLRAYAAVHARHGLWQEATAVASKALEFGPEDDANYRVLALLLVASGDTEGYRQLCQRILARFGTTAKPRTAEQLARQCSVLPSSGLDWAVVDRLARTAVSGAVSNDDFISVWYLRFAGVTDTLTDVSNRFLLRAECTKGLAAYRQGDFADAIVWMQRMLGRDLRQSPGILDDARDAQAYAVLAMARHQLKQTDEARAALAKAVEIVETKLPKLDSGDIGRAWADWIITHALLDEAKMIIESGSKPVGEPK